MKHLFDSHCHLQDSRLHNTLDGCIERALAAGVVKMVCCGCCEDDWQEIIALSHRYSCIVPALGLHPWFCSRRSARWFDTLSGLLGDFPHCTVGEIGLDHALPERNDEEQLLVFKEQLLLAYHLNRTVSIHCRKAWGSLLTLFRTKAVAPSSGLVLHSYSGAVDIIPELESYGISLSFSGAVTYEKNRRVRDAVKAASSGKLLVETDSPDIPPNNHSGLNEPSTLPMIIGSVAALRGVAVEEIARLTTANATALYPV